MIKNIDLLKMYNDGKYNDLHEALKENAREEMQTAAGARKTKAETIIKNLVKGEIKNSFNRATRKAHNITINGKPMYMFTDSHRLFISDTNYGFEIAEPQETFKFDFVNNLPESGQFETKPDEIKAFSSACKKFLGKNHNKSFAYADENIKILFDPEYITAAADFTESNTFYYDTSLSKADSCYKTLVWSHNDDFTKICVVLPVFGQDFEKCEYFYKHYSEILSQ